MNMKNNNKDLAGHDYKAVFNKLSFADRLSLKAAALTKAITGFIRDDTEEHPERYPVYAAYLAVVSASLAVPFTTSFILGGPAVWARYSKSESARKLNERIKCAFNDEALATKHKEFLEPDPEKRGFQKVKNASLAWDTSKQTMQHSWQATKHAWNAVKKFTIK